MKRIVIYESVTGFTKQYAEWIAEELQCKTAELKTVTKEKLAEYEQVIFGGWVCAGKVNGYEKVKSFDLANLVVYAVGMSPASGKTEEKLANDNKIDRSRFFYFEGGYRPEKVGFFSRILMKMLKKSLEKKADKSEEDVYMLETFDGAERAEKEAIRPLLQFCETEE
ncbi:MAG: flavodoxin domain-containing protein [Lachnospiraceae bacterium]